MDFVYDKIQVAAADPAITPDLDEDSTPQPDQGPNPNDDPTSNQEKSPLTSPQEQKVLYSHERKPSSSLDIAADKLENGIELAYTKLTTVATNTNWSSLWATVKKQGEAALKETTKDISAFRQEVGSLLTDSNDTTTTTTTDNDQSSNKEIPQSSPTSSQSPSISANLASSQETLVKPQQQPSTMLSELTKRAQLYIDTLDRDLEKLENAAGSYVGKLGQDVKSFLKDAVTVDAPTTIRNGGSDYDSESGEDAPAEILFDIPEAVRTQIYSTRLDAQLYALHTSAQPFLTTTAEPDYEEFAKHFNIDSNTKNIAEDLDKYKPLRSLMESLVPEKVTYKDFWAKYYYMRKQIQEQEQRRKLLVQKAAEQADKDITWDDEDEDEEGTVDKSKNPLTRGTSVIIPSTTASSTRSSTDDSYDLVSKTNSAIDLSQKNEGKSSVTAEDDDEEEEDWE